MFFFCLFVFVFVSYLVCFYYFILLLFYFILFIYLFFVVIVGFFLVCLFPGFLSCLLCVSLFLSLFLLFFVIAARGREGLYLVHFVFCRGNGYFNSLVGRFIFCWLEYDIRFIFFMGEGGGGRL